MRRILLDSFLYSNWLFSDTVTAAFLCSLPPTHACVTRFLFLKKQPASPPRLAEAISLKVCVFDAMNLSNSTQGTQQAQSKHTILTKKKHRNNGCSNRTRWCPQDERRRPNDVSGSRSSFRGQGKKCRSSRVSPL